MSARLAVRALAVLGVLAVLGTSAARAQDSILVRVGGDLAARTGDYLDVPVTVDLTAAPGRKLGGYRLRLLFPSSALSFSELLPGTFAEPQMSVIGDTVRATALLPAGATGVVTLFTARFYVYADTGAVPLTLSVNELTAAQSSSTPFEDLTPLVRVVNGTFCRSKGKWGDVDGDGASGSRDALVTLSYVVGLPVDTTMQPLLADVDADSRVTSRDALIMLSYAVGLPVPGHRVLLTAAGSCGTGAATTLALSADTLTLVPGQAAQVSVTALDGTGRGVPAAGVVWSFADGNVAGWDPYNSDIVARSAGLTTATAVLGPGVQARLVVRVLPRRPNWYVDVRRATNTVTRDGSLRYPMAFIGDAVGEATNGDTIRVAGGIYEETVTGTRNVAILGDPLDRPVVDTRALCQGECGSYYNIELGDGSGDLTVQHVVFKGSGLRSLAHNTVLQNLRFESMTNWQPTIQVESQSDPLDPYTQFPGNLGNATLSDLVLVSYVCYGIQVVAGDTVVVRNSQIDGQGAGQQCEGAGPAIEVGGSYQSDAASVEVRDNVLSRIPGPGIRITTPSARALVARNRIESSETGIAASAPQVTTTHNVVVVRPAYWWYYDATAIDLARDFPADSVRSVGDSVSVSNAQYARGLRVDSVRLAGVIDSLIADSVGVDSVYTQSGTAVELLGGRFTVSNSRIRYAGQYGIRLYSGVGSSLVSRNNRFDGIGSVALNAESDYYYGTSLLDSAVSVGDTIRGARTGGMHFASVARVRVDSAFVDSLGTGSAAVNLSSLVSRASILRSTLRRAYVGLQSTADTLLAARNTIRRDTTAILLLTPSGVAPDSARIFGNQLDSNTLNGLESQGGVFSADSNTMVGNGSAGVRVVSGAGGRVTRSRLQGNVYGSSLGFNATGPLVITNSNIEGNTTAGASNETASFLIDARNNYWGSANGPRCDSSVCSPTGGDRLEPAALVQFDPFLSSPVTVTPSAPFGVSAARLTSPATTMSTAPVQVRTDRRSEPQVAPQPRRALRTEPTRRELPPMLRKGRPPRPPAGVRPQS